MIPPIANFVAPNFAAMVPALQSRFRLNPERDGIMFIARPAKPELQLKMAKHAYDTQTPLDFEAVEGACGPYTFVGFLSTSMHRSNADPELIDRYAAVLEGAKLEPGDSFMSFPLEHCNGEPAPIIESRAVEH